MDGKYQILKFSIKLCEKYAFAILIRLLLLKISQLFSISKLCVLTWIILIPWYNNYYWLFYNHFEARPFSHLLPKIAPYNLVRSETFHGPLSPIEIPTHFSAYDEPWKNKSGNFQLKWHLPVGSFAYIGTRKVIWWKKNAVDRFSHENCMWYMGFN